MKMCKQLRKMNEFAVSIGENICYECGKDISANEEFYVVDVLISGLPDTWFVCKECGDDMEVMMTKEEYYEELNEMFENAKKEGGTPIDVFDLWK